ncbi:MAG: patatin [Proteobacteria bacterium]|nr:MAG: patatin [Pseudomonadota bacterium]
MIEELKSKPFTLALSSGFFGFFAHHGFSLALKEVGLTPARVTGSSAGSIVAGAWAYGMTSEELQLVLKDLRRESFWDPGFGFGFLKGAKLESFLRELFQGREQEIPIAISTFDILSRRTRSFTAEAGAGAGGNDIPKFIRASCAVPLMFHPVKIESRFYLDGGIRDKPALDSIQPGETVLSHYLPRFGPEKIYENQNAVTLLRRKHLVIAADTLPDVGPNKLDNGLRAMEAAYEHAIKALRA